MSEILKQIRANLKIAMLAEIEIRKTESSGDLDFITSQQSLLEKSQNQKTVSRSIISMFPQIGKKPADATDDDVIKLLKRYISQEKERQLYIDKHLTEVDVRGLNLGQLKEVVNKKIQELKDSLTSPVIEIAQSYLPKQATKYEVTLWIAENIDLASYKNKMQAMGPIMKQFKGCDGNFIRSILMNL